MNKNESNPIPDYRMERVLRGVDLNLLTVFDAVMREQNITRAAQHLNMSQPAVSNAVSRLKVMFADELFVRQGRGIQPTPRARQMYGTIRQALQLIRNELPTATFNPATSSRMFKVAFGNQNDMRFLPSLLAAGGECATNINIQAEANIDEETAKKLCFQDLDCVVDYTKFEAPNYKSVELFSDELVVVAAKSHPRVQQDISLEQLSDEKHAKLAPIDGLHTVSQVAYSQLSAQVNYQGSSLSNLLYVVSQSELLSIVPRWVAMHNATAAELQIIELPLKDKKVSGYLSWHDSCEKDNGHRWFRELVDDVCRSVVSKESL